MNALDLLLFASIVGFVGGIVVAIAGVLSQRQMVAIVGLVGTLAFGAAVALYGTDL